MPHFKRICFTVAIIVAAFIGISTGSCLARDDVGVEHRGAEAAGQPVTATVPRNIADVNKLLHDTFDASIALEKYRHGESFISDKLPPPFSRQSLFPMPSDQQLRAYLPGASGIKNLDYHADNPLLLSYLAIPPQKRRDDIFLTDVGGPENYWLSSEYYYRGKPVKFMTDFLLHLDPEGDSQTVISVLEVNPHIIAGKKFYLLHPEHEMPGPPGFYDHYLNVMPTRKEREDLLALAVDLVKSSGNIEPYSLSTAAIKQAAQRVRQAQTEANNAMNICVDPRITGEHKTHVSYVNCSNPNITVAYRKDGYPYMDLIDLWTKKRMEIAARIDAGTLTLNAGRSEAARNALQINAVQRQRDSSLPSLPFMRE